jgi:hypothetical protein
MVSKECKNRVRFFGSLKSKTVGGTEFGSRLLGEAKFVDEV